MSTLRSSFNPAAWDFKPRQAEGWPMPADVKASPSTCDTQKRTLPEDNVSKWQPTPPIPEGCPGNASCEELRLKDYDQGKGKLNVNGAATFKPSAVPSVSFPAAALRGSGIDIHVGKSELPCDQWSLPINLISHYSPYLKAASTPNDEGPIGKINLPEHDPAVFGLFVEWMYYGRYDATSTAPDPHVHGKCWILGDKLQCPEFKNYVMGLLYTQHITLAFAKSITGEEVQYVCDNTSSNAKLRQFYENFVVKYYATTDRLQGSTEEWDALFQKHSAMRFALLQSMRHGFTGGTLMKDVSEYLEPTEGLLKPDIKPAEGLLNLDLKPIDGLLKPNPESDEDSTTSPTKEETGEPAQPVNLQDGLQWTFDPKLDKTASGSPSSIKIEEREEKEKEEEKETQTIVDRQVQDEVREGASIMHHVPQGDTGSLSTIKGSEQEDTDETLVNADLGPKSKKKKWRRNKAKGHLVNKTLELSVGDDQQTDSSSSGHESEQVSTEQTEAEATPESAEDEENFSTDSEPDSFADLVKANRERQEAGLPNLPEVPVANYDHSSSLRAGGLVLAPQTIGEKQRAEDKVLLTLESILEASAKSSPGLVVVAVLELGLGSSSPRRVLVVPLAPVTSDTKSLRVKLGPFASAILNLENLCKVGPAVVVDSLSQLNLSVSPIVGVVKGVGVSGIGVDPPLVAVSTRAEAVAGNGVGVLGNIEGVDEELELSVQGAGLDGEGSGNSLRESTLLASGKEQSVVTLDLLDGIEEVLLVLLDQLGQRSTNITELDESAVCSLRLYQSLAKLAGKVKGSSQTTTDETNSHTRISRDQTSEDRNNTKC
ncbi:hypothetical protein HG530_015210 [Fusarium avenaceum]|nr:hypothetical protein HG530_015210 [Fusarium avenaceum]